MNHHIDPEELIDSILSNKCVSPSISSNFPVDGEFYKFEYTASLKLEEMLQAYRSRSAIADLRYSHQNPSEHEHEEKKWEPRYSQTYKVDGVLPDSGKRLVRKPLPIGSMFLTTAVLNLSRDEKKLYCQIDHRGWLSWDLVMMGDDLDLLHSDISEIMAKYGVDDFDNFPIVYADEKHLPWPRNKQED